MHSDFRLPPVLFLHRLHEVRGLVMIFHTGGGHEEGSVQKVAAPHGTEAAVADC